MGLRHQLHLPVRMLHGIILPERPFTRHRPGCWVRMAISFRSSERPSLNPRRLPNSQEFKLLQNRLGTSSAKLQHSVSSKNPSPFCMRAYDNSGQRVPSSAGIESNEKKAGAASILTKLLKRLVKALGGLLLAAILLAAALPSFLSSSFGKKAAISMANRSIPGTFNVSVVKLGWSRPIFFEGVTLQGTDGENVISIPKMETKAPLWSLVLGKSGLGDCTVTSPTIDLQQHPTNNLPRIALAVAPAEKLLEPESRTKLAKRKPQEQLPLPPAKASLMVSVNGPNGGLQITDGTIIFPSDVASVLGDRLIVDVGVGHYATKESEELKDAEDKNEGEPLLASFWSETVQAEAMGLIQKKSKKVKLIKPLKAEMDLTPAVAKFYLARVNPLLGEIVGPAIRDEDMPDVIVQLTPANLELPSDHYKVHIAPMKVTLARGQVVDGVLSLLSKQNLAKGRQDLTMQTSVIEAEVDMPSSVESKRLDILIADKVHVATWGSLDWIEETVKMTLAIPGTTLQNLMGLTKVPPKYYLQVPVGGTLEKPVVDWRKAGLGIAELTARQRGGKFVQNLFDFFDAPSNEKSTSSTPEPIEPLPWEAKASN